MPRNGTGVYTLPNPPFVAGTIISSSVMNQNLQDIAAALTGSVAADGQTPFSGQILFPNGTSTAPGISFQSDTGTGLFNPAPFTLGFSASGLFTIQVNSASYGPGADGSVLTQINGAVLQPVGTVQDYAGPNAPPGWFFCYGQAVSRSFYPELFTVIGTRYGVGDGSTTYNLPDLRGLATAGRDDMGGTPANRITNIPGTVLGASGGEQSHTLSVAELAAHNHGVNDPQHQHDLFANSGNSGVGGINTVDVSTPSGTNKTGLSSTGISIQNAGSNTPHNNLQPTYILNKIIFAGRQ